MLEASLLATKFYFPPPPAVWIRRPRLVQTLSDGLLLARSLTLVSAPAGFGKTSAVSQWIDGLDRESAVWLSLDPTDDDPQRFFSYFIAALQKFHGRIGQETAGALHDGQLPEPEAIITNLVNDLVELGAASNQVYLFVLDDFHVIQNAIILDVFWRLIENIPQNLHIILITREDPPLPLARLRAHNRLTEIRASDLRFSGPEAKRFFEKSLDVPLSPADAGWLEERTEGWIAGLQLAAIALQSRPAAGQAPDSASLIDDLAGSHRFILDYLTEQVLQGQTPEIRDFLLKTSILNRLSGGLCDAVSGRADSHFLLQALLKANLFLVPLDNEGRWYRYHHLFADLLRSQQRALEDEELSILHLGAARWYAAAGMAEEAVGHALAARDYGLVMELLEAHAVEMIGRGLAKTVQGWLEAVPDAWRRPSTRMDLAFAWMHMLRGAYPEAEPYLARAETALPAVVSGDQTSLQSASLKSQALAMRSLFQQMGGDLPLSTRLAERALALAPQQDAYARSMAYFALASVLQVAEEIPASIDAFRQAIRQARAADYPVVEMLSTVGLARTAFEHGRLRLAAEIAEPAVARLERSGALPPISGVLYGVLAEVYYEWQQLDKARRCSKRALALSTFGGYNSGLIICRVYFSRLNLIEGNLEEAARELQLASDRVQQQLPDYVRQEYIAQSVRLYLARKQPDAARLALQGELRAAEMDFAPWQAADFGADPSAANHEARGYLDFPEGMRLSHAAGLMVNSALRLLLYNAAAQSDPDALLKEGVRLADELLVAAIAANFLLVAVETILLRAQMQALLGQDPTADYERAVFMGEPEGIVGVFVEQGRAVGDMLQRLMRQNRFSDAQTAYVGRIIELARGQPRWLTAQPLPQQVGLPEPLTERELDVLRLIEQGLKYSEIAGTLFISLNTVRFHVKAIYGKLEVNNRAQAVEKGRYLHIL